MNPLEKQLLKSSFAAGAFIKIMKSLNTGFRKENIAMFHTGRCGSTVLGNLLNQHPEIKWSGEIFAQMPKKYAGCHWCMEEPLKLLQLRMYKDRARYYGFETKATKDKHLKEGWVNMELSAYIKALVDLGYGRFMILERKNYLRKLVSTLIGRKTGMLHTTSQKKDIVLVQIDLQNVLNKEKDPKTLLQYFEDLENHYAELQLLLSKHEPLYLTYEGDILNNPILSYENICSYLGIPIHPVNIKHKRTNPFELSQLIENYEAVAEVMQNTKYAWMLET